LKGKAGEPDDWPFDLRVREPARKVKVVLRRREVS
jgi:hypothetical protein